MVRQKEINPVTAEAHLRPWLAIACLCGADLPELVEPLADLTAKDAGSDSWIVSEAVARFMLSGDICPRQRWVSVLAKARDEAAATADLIAADQFATPDRRAAARLQAVELDAIARALALDPSGRFPVPPATPLRSALPERSAA